VPELLLKEVGGSLSAHRDRPGCGVVLTPPTAFRGSFKGIGVGGLLEDVQIKDLVQSFPQVFMPPVDIYIMNAPAWLDYALNRADVLVVRAGTYGRWQPLWMTRAWALSDQSVFNLPLRPVSAVGVLRIAKHKNSRSFEARTS
jgi:hypothetical protein